MLYRSLLIGALMFTASCSKGRSVAVDLTTFTLDPVEIQEIEAAEESGAGAEGAIDYNETTNILTISVTASDFDCEGKPVSGDTLVATVTQLDATTMIWDMDGDIIEWTRIDDSGTGIEGVWKNVDDEGTFFLLVNSNGTAQLVNDEGCDGEEDGRTKNDQSCLVGSLTGLSITVDGDLSDWTGIQPEGVLEDTEGDANHATAGGDIKSLKMEIEHPNLYLLVEFYTPPSSDFFRPGPPPANGELRFHVADRGGSNIYSRVIYSEGNSAWEFISGDAAWNLAVTPDGTGMEFSIPLSQFPSEPFFDIIRFEARDCAAGSSCTIIDELDECMAIDGFGT